MRSVLSIKVADQAQDGACPGYAELLLSIRKTVSQVNAKKDSHGVQTRKPWNPGKLPQRARVSQSVVDEPSNSVETGVRGSRDGHWSGNSFALVDYILHLTSISGNERQSRQASSFIEFSRVDQHGVKNDTGSPKQIGPCPCAEGETEIGKPLPPHNAIGKKLTKLVGAAPITFSVTL